MDKKTPLYEKHVDLGARMVSFAGYQMPIQYRDGIIAEHNHVRGSVGIFDVSHMGEISISGNDALKTVNYCLTNDFSDMEINRCRYTMATNGDGGIVDDMIVYRREDSFMLVPNAANKDAVLKHLRENDKYGSEIADESNSWAQMAVQGPESQGVLQNLTDYPLENLKYYHFVEHKLSGVDCIISRTGYTGEDGFEVYCPSENAVDIYNAILNSSDSVKPIGLGARDTLRLEAGMNLYGNDMDLNTNPYEVASGFAVKLDKEEMVGLLALREAKQNVTRKRVGLKITGRGIAREGQEVYSDGVKIGMVTSGTKSPTLGYPIAIAIVDSNFTDVGRKVIVKVRNRDIEAEIVKMPFYKKN